MTSTIAVIGKSGSGKTTITKAFHKLLSKKFPNSSILLVDNDLSLELSESFGIKTRNTIYGIKSGKHEYKTGIPEGMTKQEYIEWALEDIIIEIDDNTDMIASWLTTPKDCQCISTKLMRASLLKLIDRYDFVIFDCEYDLKYLNSLIDCEINEAIIISNSQKENIALCSKIANSSKKYASQGQLGIILNKSTNKDLDTKMELLNTLELNLIGLVEEQNPVDYEVITNKLEGFYSRMNLPQVENN